MLRMAGMLRCAEHMLQQESVCCEARSKAIACPDRQDASQLLLRIRDGLVCTPRLPGIANMLKS